MSPLVIVGKIGCKAPTKVTTENDMGVKDKVAHCTFKGARVTVNTFATISDQTSAGLVVKAFSSVLPPGTKTYFAAGQGWWVSADNSFGTRSHATATAAVAAMRQGGVTEVDGPKG